MRTLLKKKIKLCTDAIFFVEPIEGWNQLYVQRQRWQRGEIEVAHIFLKRKLNLVKEYLSNFALRVLVYDHTFAWPRMIWYFALIFLVATKYSWQIVAISLLLMYALYVVTTLLFYINVICYLGKFPELRRYYARKCYLIFLFPIYNTIIFWFRFSGIINAMTKAQTWKVQNMTEERHSFFAVVKQDLTRLATCFV